MKTSSITLSEIRFHAASSAERERGLLGFITAILNGGLRVDGLALRRTLEGRLTISYPERRDADGHNRPVIRPIDNATRLALEEQVFAALPGAIEEDAR